MKCRIVFFSFSGNTRNVGGFLKEKFEASNHKVALIDLKLKQEVTSFFKQSRQAFFRNIPELTNTDYSLNDSDVVFFAAPVWAFTYVRALRAYLNQGQGMEGKKAGIMALLHTTLLYLFGFIGESRGVDFIDFLDSRFRGHDIWLFCNSAIIFTHESSIGSQKAVTELKDVLLKRQCEITFSKSIQGSHTSDQASLMQELRPVLEMFCS